MPNATPLPCSHRKYVDAGWLVKCNACGFDSLTAEPERTTKGAA